MIPPLEVNSSKSKLLFLLLGAIALVAGGIWLIVIDAFPRQRSLLLMVVILNSVFFGGCLIYIARKVFDKNLGLVLDERGLTDNGSALAAGYIPWSDINRIDTLRIHNQRFVLLFVSDPQQLISKQSGMFKRRMMSMNWKLYGTPVCLTTTGLKISFDNMLKEIVARYDAYSQM